MTHSRLLIEEWLPAQAIGVECMRENSSGLHPPPNRLHVWWARRPLVASRAAVLASLLPADYDRRAFERLLGFYGTSEEIIATAERLASKQAGQRVAQGHGKRAFSNAIPEPDVLRANSAMADLWGGPPTVLDPMAGGGSIPLEAARLGLSSVANEYNPVACCVLETTVTYPFSHGQRVGEKARKWGDIWEKRFNARLSKCYEYPGFSPPRDYIFARTVPCPDTGHPTPLVPDWHLLKPKTGRRIVAEPVILNKAAGQWTVRIREVGSGAGQLRQPPVPTYARGHGVSLFTGQVIPVDYIKAKAQQGQMGSVLYAVAVKATNKMDFRPVEETDLVTLAAADAELARLRPTWERNDVVPVENIPPGDKTLEPLRVGHTTWASLFSPRQLLALGVLVEELRRLRAEIVQAEGLEIGEAVVHLLALALDKFANWNAMLSSWNAPYATLRSVFDRHDFSFKATYAEMAVCVPDSGLKWALDSTIDAYIKIVVLPHVSRVTPVSVSQGSAAHLLHLDDGSVTAVVVDPPYADNVQYSELADFFYVWLKRTQGHRRPEWFSTYLCEHAEEAVVNVSRHRDGEAPASEAREESNRFYQRLMGDCFREAHRILRDDGVLTVMFTHKQQSAWAALFESLISAGFTITATWPVQTEGQHSLHQAQKNAAQSTVILACRKRPANAGLRYFDASMQDEIRQAAQCTAARLRDEGLNAVDQLVGSFGPAMEVFSRCDEVRTDTGQVVGVAEAIQLAADAVADWRVAQLAERGLQGVDPESRFVLLCWDVLGAAEFRFNEAMLLGRSVGMGVDQLADAGLISKSGDKVNLLPAAARRRADPIATEAEQMDLFGSRPGRRRRGGSRKVHPGDEYFASAIDMCHALALRHAEAGGGQAGLGAAKGMALQQGWNADSLCARLMEALVHAAPEAVRFGGKGKQKTVADLFPEFRAWHAMLQPLFGLKPPEWKAPVRLQATLRGFSPTDEDGEVGDDEA